MMASVGEVLSMVTTSPLEAGLKLPTPSVALAVTVCTPSVGVEAVIDQFPPVAMPVPMAVVPSVPYKVTVEPASAVPINTGMTALVMLSELDTPLSLAAARTGADGAAGSEVSKVSAGVVPAPPLLPAISV
ncbi:hypothetical protein D3C71_1652820 [compost metagenome]